MAKGNRTTSKQRVQTVAKATVQPTHSAIFSALDLIDIARGDFESTFAVFSVLIDHDVESTSPGLMVTMERHMRRDLDALRAAESECRRALLGKGVQHERHPDL